MSVFSGICVSVLLGVWVVETVLFVLSYRTSGRTELPPRPGTVTTPGSQFQERQGKEAPRDGRDLGRQSGLCQV